MMRIISRLLLYAAICLLPGMTASVFAQQPAGELLYNGIRLPEEWPPRYPVPSQRESMRVPYLETPPEVIDINVGRQLFVDDFLIDSTDMKHVCHQARMYEGNPVLVGDKPWDIAKGVPFADVYSGGVWFDELDGKFKVWYRSGEYEVDGRKVCSSGYAESLDGKHWVKPELDVFPGTNIIDTTAIDNRSVWLDKLEKDPSKRFKSTSVNTDLGCRFQLRYSSDGIHWSDVKAMSDSIQDRSTINYNPFRKKWVASIRVVVMTYLRARAYAEDSDLETLINRIHNVQEGIYGNEDNPAGAVYWFTADDRDYRHPVAEFAEEFEPALYNFDSTPYESITLGHYSIWRGPQNWHCDKHKIQKLNEYCIGFSRDGFHYSRPDHTPFMESVQEEEAWNWGNMQPAIGNPCIVGDSLYFWCGGHKRNDIYWDGWTSTGLATLRRDGFVSMEDEGRGGVLVTRPVLFDGKHLFVNAAAGYLAVEVLDLDGKVLRRSGRMEDFDSTRKIVRWKGHASLSSLAGRPVRFRFTMKDGQLYSFWVSPWKSGESRGYLGGGGPGLNPSGIDEPF